MAMSAHIQAPIIGQPKTEEFVVVGTCKKMRVNTHSTCQGVQEMTKALGWIVMFLLLKSIGQTDWLGSFLDPDRLSFHTHQLNDTPVIKCLWTPQ
jgi:hypothetical protein